MKKLIISILMLHGMFFISHEGLAQGCLPEGITFGSQAQIDNFKSDYPGCTQIEGDVSITKEGWGNVYNLDSLNILTDIGGDLTIYNTGLINLKGLENLQKINGTIRIMDNSLLTSLSGLENIDKSAVKDLFIHDNTSLAVCDFEWVCEYLSSPNGSVNIYQNAPGCENPPELASNCGIQLPCLPYGNYYFFSQAEVDSFLADYPDCSDLQGSVSIHGSDIVDLSGLSQVTSISGNLNIGNDYGDSAVGNPLLSSLTGLENLTEIGGTLMIIRKNESLSNLDGLDNLTSIGGALLIGISYSHTARNIEALTNIKALSNLTSVGGQLYISSTWLTNLEGLENLSSIGGSFEIWSNVALGNFAGLENLTSIGGEMRIHYNPNLTSLTGLDNIEANSISYIHITNNPSLSACDVKSICAYLAGPYGPEELGDNASGCNSQEQVKVACAEGVEESAVGSQQSAVSVVPNPAFSRSEIKYQISKCKSVVLKVLDIRGSEVCTLINEVQAQGEHGVDFDVSGLPAGIYVVRLEAGEAVATEKMVVIR